MKLVLCCRKIDENGKMKMWRSWCFAVVKLMKMGRRKREEVGTLLSWSWWENEEGGASKNDIYFCTEIDGSPIVYWKLLQEVSSYYKSEILHILRQSWCSQARISCRIFLKKVKMKTWWSWCFAVVMVMKMWRWKCVNVDALLSWWWWKCEDENLLKMTLYLRDGDKKNEEAPQKKGKKKFSFPLLHIAKLSPSLAI